MPENERNHAVPARVDELVGAIWEESTRLETVLVVHGYASLREALVRTLQHYGYRALEASSREQAVRVTRRERADLVLVDYALGKGDAPALAATFAAGPETWEIPVLALSSDVVARDALERFGFRDAIVMPVDQHDLLAAVDRALEATRRRRREGLRLERSDEQCRLPLEDRLRSEHLSLFFRFVASARIDLHPANEPLIQGIVARLRGRDIHPDIRVEGGELVVEYEITIADAFSLATEDPAEDLCNALSQAFPELATRPEPLRQRIGTLEAEFRRLQRIAS